MSLRSPARQRRWLRLVLPIASALLVIAVTGMFRAIEEPDRTDPAYLSPAADEPTSAGDLASRLRARGIALSRETRTSDALLRAHRGDTTLVIPTPGLVQWRYLEMIALLPETTRVILVEPSELDLRNGRVPLSLDDVAWATMAPAPTPTGLACVIPGAEGANRAAVTRSRYSGPGALSCYDQGLTRVSVGHTEVVVVGSADLFRNDRIGEHDNATLAVGLLATRPTVIWLDLHETEPAPLVNEDANPNGTPVPPSLNPGNEPDGNPQPGNEPQGRGTPPPGVAAPQSGGSEEPSLWDVFPTALWAILVGVLLMLLLLALWRARRLGRPVHEPLPVSVRGAETLLGRARLYQRATATGTSLETLRQALRPRIAEGLGLHPATDPETLTEAVLERLGGNPDKVAAAISGAWPTTEKEMLRLARVLTRIHEAVRGMKPDPDDDQGDDR